MVMIVGIDYNCEIMNLFFVVINFECHVLNCQSAILFTLRKKVIRYIYGK